MHGIEALEKEIFGFIEKLDGKSEIYKNIKINELITTEEFYFWEICAEFIKGNETHYASILYYPKEDKFRGVALGDYETRDLAMVKCKMASIFDFPGNLCWI